MALLAASVAGCPGSPGATDTGPTDAPSRDAAVDDAARGDAPISDAPGADAPASGFPIADGIEARATELAGMGVEVCSEPMNGPESATSGVLPPLHDFESSDDETACFTDGRGGNYYAFIPERPWASVSTAPWGDAFGSSRYAAQYDGFTFFTGRRPGGLGEGPLTMCYRYYIQVSADYAPAAADCDGSTRRTKLAEAFWSVDGASVSQIQFEEPQQAGCPSAHPAAVELGWDAGPGEAAHGNVNLSPAVSLGSCVDAPCRVELCIDGSITTGQDIHVRARMHSISTGVTGTADAGTYDLPPSSTPHAGDAWGGDIFHTGPGESIYGFFVSAVWPDADASQWIGCAAEVEGEGCGP